jgi:membrane protease YdiL (CAAX protease family)
LFAAIHPQGWAAIPVLASVGFVFAAVREWRASIIAPMVGHALNNATVVTMLVVALG